MTDETPIPLDDDWTSLGSGDEEPTDALAILRAATQAAKIGAAVNRRLRVVDDIAERTAATQEAVELVRTIFVARMNAMDRAVASSASMTEELAGQFARLDVQVVEFIEAEQARADRAEAAAGLAREEARELAAQERAADEARAAWRRRSAGEVARAFWQYVGPALGLVIGALAMWAAGRLVDVPEQLPTEPPSISAPAEPGTDP